MTVNDRLEHFIQNRPNVWINATEFEQFGRQAWRTRISESRRRLEARGEGTIENRVMPIHTLTQAGERKRYLLSQYRFVPAESKPAVDAHGQAWLSL